MCDLWLGDEWGAFLVRTMKALWLTKHFVFTCTVHRYKQPWEWWQFITFPLHQSIFILLYLEFLGCFQKITNPSTDILKCISYNWTWQLNVYNYLFWFLNFQLVFTAFIRPLQTKYVEQKPADYCALAANIYLHIATPVLKRANWEMDLSATYSTSTSYSKEDA